MRTHFVRFACAFALATLVFGGIVLPASSRGPFVGIEQQPVDQPGKDVASHFEGLGLHVSTDIRLRTASGHPKLESALADFSSTYVAESPERMLALAEQRGIRITDGLARVVIEADPGGIDEIASGIGPLGAREEARHGNLVQVSVPMGALNGLAELPQVNFVRRPFTPRMLPITGDGSSAPLGDDNALLAVANEGVQAIGADAWHSVGIRGQGTSVAIIDVGFFGYESKLGVELPATVVTTSFRADGDITGGGERHGTAVAEIVHAVAPETTLYLINFDTDVEWANAVDFAISEGVDIISSSIAFLFGPFDGTGFFDEKVDEVRNSGIFWAQAAGNYATDHWQGNFDDPNDNSILDFAPGDEVNVFSVPPDWGILIVLTWNDWPASDQDYDLFLFEEIDGQWELVDLSTNTQAGTAPPFEAILGTTFSGGTFGIVIHQFSATRDARFQLFALDLPPPGMSFQVAETSLAIPADSASVVTAGAFDVENGELEPFSSRGPTVDGRIKPDILAPDGVSSSSYSPHRFFGTSASAPHLAGAAALVKSLDPSLGPSEIQEILERMAVELGPPGKDNLFGAGGLSLASPDLSQP